MLLTRVSSRAICRDVAPEEQIVHSAALAGEFCELVPPPGAFSVLLASFFAVVVLSLGSLGGRLREPKFGRALLLLDALDFGPRRIRAAHSAAKFSHCSNLHAAVLPQFGTSIRLASHFRSAFCPGAKKIEVTRTSQFLIPPRSRRERQSESWWTLAMASVSTHLASPTTFFILMNLLYHCHI